MTIPTPLVPLSTFSGSARLGSWQILFLLAKELGGFVTVVGGPACGYMLLQCFELMCDTEETVVRDAAAAAFASVRRPKPATRSNAIGQSFAAPARDSPRLPHAYVPQPNRAQSDLHPNSQSISQSNPYAGWQVTAAMEWNTEAKEKCLSMVKNLSAGDWFTKKVVAAQLYSTPYLRCAPIPR
jgi:hypothetical protein